MKAGRTTDRKIDERMGGRANRRKNVTGTKGSVQGEDERQRRKTVEKKDWLKEKKRKREMMRTTKPQ